MSNEVNRLAMTTRFLDQRESRGRRRRRLVASTFVSSTVLFCGAICYEYMRPWVLERVVKAFKSIPLSANQFNDGWTFSSRIPTAATATILVEILVLVPLVLSVLPLTQTIFGKLYSRKIHTHSNGSRRVENPLTKEVNRTETKRIVPPCVPAFINILKAIAWSLWTFAGVILVTGVLYGSKVFGLISVSALLALFAQGVGSIGILATSRPDDYEDTDAVKPARTDDQRRGSLTKRRKGEDDVWRETREIEKPPNEMGAGEWMRKQQQEGRVSSADFKRQDSSISSSTQPMSQRIPNGKKAIGRKVDIIIFFLVNTVLLQSPYYLHIAWHFLHDKSSDALMLTNLIRPKDVVDNTIPIVIPIEVPAVLVFISTVVTPLFTHGVGGQLFVGKGWSFHHPFEGGKEHVISQATGWSLLCMAVLLHLSFVGLGMNNQYVYLLHSGSLLSWCAEILLVYSLVSFRSRSDDGRAKVRVMEGEGKDHTITIKRSKILFIMSILQDLVLTNMHWFYLSWFTSSLCGFNAFSLDPMAKVFNASVKDALSNTSLVVAAWVAAALVVPYSRTRKRWEKNPFGLLNDRFEQFLFHPDGLFHDSVIVLEEESQNYQCGGIMFAMAPHGALPTYIWALLHQCTHIFTDVCFFFGSQIAIVPGYRYMSGMRGGLLPIDKKRLLSVMATRQSVALVPGGVSEMLQCVPRARVIKVSIKHKGFVRLALQQGYDLVPTFIFNANDAYDNPMREFQSWTYKRTGIPVGLPWYTNRWGLPISNRKPLRVALGRVIKVRQTTNPSQDEVDEIHKQFYQEIVRVWEKHKEEFGYGDRELAYFK